MALLGADGPAFCAYYDVSRHGNWEDVNILWAPRPLAIVAGELNMAPVELEALIARSKPKLMEARARRVRPGLDDKILLGWNALMIHALCKASGALGEEKYARMAERAMRLLLEKMRRPGKPLPAGIRIRMETPATRRSLMTMPLLSAPSLLYRKLRVSCRGSVKRKRSQTM